MAADVCKALDLPDDVRPMLADGPVPQAFLDRLLEQRHDLVAIDFLAHALPPREADWWGCLCAPETAGPEQPPKPTAALKAAVQWVLDPNDAHRRAAQGPDEANNYETPAGCLAMAAFWSGGSLNPPNLPAVAPTRDMPAKAVAGAVQMAATGGDVERVPEILRRCVQLGIAVAKGKVVWPAVEKDKN